MGDCVEGGGVGSSVMIVGAGVGSSVIDTDPAGDAVQKTVSATFVWIPLPLQLKLSGGLTLKLQTCSFIQSYCEEIRE